MAQQSARKQGRSRTRPIPSPAQRAAAASTAPNRTAVTAGMDLWDKVVWYSLHALVFLVPVAMSNLTFFGIGGGAPLTYDQFDIAKVFVMRACLLVALAAWAWKIGSRGGKIRTTKVDWLILIFLGWVAITSMTSISPATAIFGKYRRFEGLLSFLTYAGTYFLVLQVVDRRSRIRSLMRTLFFSGLVVAGYGFLQYLSLGYTTTSTLAGLSERLAVVVPLAILTLMRVFDTEDRSAAPLSRGVMLPAVLTGVAAVWALVLTFVQSSSPKAVAGYQGFEWLLVLLAAAAVVSWGLVTEKAPRSTTFGWSASASSLLLLLGGVYAYHQIDVSHAAAKLAVTFDPIPWGNLPFEANRSFSTYGNPDLLGGFLVFSLIISLGLALSEERVSWRVLYWLGFLLSAAVWVTAAVRGAWVGGAVGLAVVGVVVFLTTRMSEYRPETVDYAGAGLSFATVIGLVVRSLNAPNSVMNVASRVQSITQFGEGSALTRFEIWQAAVAAIKARPIFGFGADTFRLVFPLYKPAAYTRDAGYLSVADNVHDYPLQLASALGIIGFLLLYGVLGLVVWLAGATLSPIRADVFGTLGPLGLGLVVVVFFGLLAALWYLRDRPKLQEFAAWAFFGVFGYVLYLSAPSALSPDKGKERLLMTAIWAAALAYIVHLFFGLSVTGSTVLLWLAFALLLSPIATSRDVKAPSWGPALGVVALMLCTGAFIYNMLYVAADSHYLNARIGSQTSGVAEVQQALALNPWNDMYRAELGLAYQSDMQNWIKAAQQSQSQSGAQQQTQADATQARDSFLKAEAAFKDVIAFVPSEYDNYVFLANLYNQAGVYFDPTYYKNAVEIAQRGVKVEPYGPAIRFQLALGYNYQGDTADALRAVAEAERLDPNYTEAKMLEGDIYRRTGDLAKAKAAYQSALAVVSSADQKAVIQSSLQSIDASLGAGGSKAATGTTTKK